MRTEMKQSSDRSFILIEDSIADSDKSRVRFSQKVYCKATMTRLEYTDAEARSTWLFPDEQKERMQRFIKVTKRMKAGKKPKKNEPYRGLETMDKRYVEEMKDIIHACVHAVLDEQDTQWEADNFRWGPFAKISRKCSKESKAVALKRAKSDEREAKKAYRQMETDRDETMYHSTSQLSLESFQKPQSFRKSQRIKSRRSDSSGKILLGTPCSQFAAMSVDVTTRPV
jgi:hypothetical protein